MIRALHVFPLFGPDLTNGSEQYAYHLTQALARLPVTVDVAATQARQMRLTALFAAHWRSEYPAGLDLHNGVRVRRFPVTLRLPRLVGRALSVFIWRRWQREAVTADPQTVGAPERAALFYQRARARPRLYHWLTLLGLGPWSWPLWRWLGQAMRSYDIVLVGFSPLALVWQVTHLARRAGKPVVILPLAHLDDLYHHLTPLYDSYLQAGALLTMTAYSASVFKRLLPASHPVEVGAGVDVAEFSAPGISGERFRAKYGLGQAPLVLYVGRKERVKRYDLAVAAISDLPAGALLVMVGEDVDQLPVASARVRVLGKLPRAEVLDAFDACQVFVLPSESESFGLVILEAWMRHKPVIGNSRCGAVSALIEHGADGYLCATSRDMAARIEALLADPPLRARLGASGYQKVMTRYTWEHVSRAVYGVYQQVLEQPATR